MVAIDIVNVNDGSDVWSYMSSCCLKENFHSPPIYQISSLAVIHTRAIELLKIINFIDGMYG
jgi:hypothetical protein